MAALVPEDVAASWQMSPLAMVDSVWDGCVRSTVEAVEREVACIDGPVLSRLAFEDGRYSNPPRLVRWIGMIQDLGNPEFYVSAAGNQCAMFRDTVCADEEANRENLGRRLTGFGVPAPGLSDWARETQPPPSKRRNREEVDEEVDCLIRFYGSGDGPKLNSLVEVLGVLGQQRGQGDDDDDEVSLFWDRKPTSHRIVVRMHAMRWRVLADSFPLALPSMPDQGDERWEAGRAGVLDYLTRVLYGDATTAELVLLALIAKPASRHEDRAIGAMSLDLIVKDSRRVSVSKRLKAALSALVPRCILVRASEARMPRRSAEEELLHQTPLQVSDGTVVVLDLNLKAVPDHLRLFISDPKVLQCDFGMGCAPRLPVDVPTVVVTQDRRGTGADCQVAPHFLHYGSGEGEEEPLPPVDGALRTYLVAAREKNAEIHEDLANRLQDDFVQARQNRTIKGDEAEHRLSLWLSLCRLDAKSRGHDDATISHWAHCAKLDRLRAIRYDSLKMSAGI